MEYRGSCRSEILTTRPTSYCTVYGELSTEAKFTMDDGKWSTSIDPEIVDETNAILKAQKCATEQCF